MGRSFLSAAALVDATAALGLVVLLFPTLECFL